LSVLSEDWMGATLAVQGLAFLLAVAASQAKDPEELLTTYLSDLEKAVKNTNAKNPADRTKLEQAAKLAFDRELSSAAPNVPKPIWDYLNKHLDNLRLGDKKFPEEPWKAERTLWINGCKAVFLKEIKNAKEPESPPSTEQLFESTFDAVREVDKMFPLATDLRNDGSAMANTIFRQLLPKTTPTTKDAKLLYTERIARIDKTFPTSNDKDKTINSDSCTMLKAVAKMLFDRDLPGAKK
jgi:hypothetical protein